MTYKTMSGRLTGILSLRSSSSSLLKSQSFAANPPTSQTGYKSVCERQMLQGGYMATYHCFRAASTNLWPDWSKCLINWKLEAGCKLRAGDSGINIYQDARNCSWMYPSKRKAPFRMPRPVSISLRSPTRSQYIFDESANSLFVLFSNASPIISFKISGLSWRDPCSFPTN